MDTVTAISHSFHLLVSCRFLAWTNLNVLEEPATLLRKQSKQQNHLITMEYFRTQGNTILNVVLPRKMSQYDTGYVT